ncbi:cyclin-I2 [Sorex fumeus]|uniref:cyclin-I2 n=1 Tax=Sorex fumeus TaxID=62283 RepID=UPI0024AD50CD|nr:cyclin-I2 [Sorex fumeus]
MRAEAQRGIEYTAVKEEIRDAFQKVVLRLLELHNIFEFSGTTYNLCVAGIQCVCLILQVKERLLHCIMITSLRLAVKFYEEDEVIPRVKDFIKHYGSNYTPNELLRMELAILDTRHWDLYTGTPMEFLVVVRGRGLCSNIKNHHPQFHALVALDRPQVKELLPQRKPSLHVASLTRQLQHCMAGHQLLQFKGSTLALVIITLELERLMPDCCTPISDLLKKAQISIGEFGHCKELVQQLLRSLQISL